jgi:hypothetical protein
MKKIFKIYILIGLLTALCVSCDDILTEEPASFLTPGTFPANEQDAVAAVNAAYSRLHSTVISFYYAFVPSDIAFQGYHNQRPASYYVNLNSLNGDASGMWREDYEGISRANTVIDLVPRIDMDATLRDRLVAEAKFLRAFYYFELVRIYGGAPILDGLLSGPDELSGITRNTMEEVYNLIKQDLTDAIPDLPLSYNAVDAGRATAGAARSLLAKVHLTLQEWSSANDQLKQVVGTSNYGLVADYKQSMGNAGRTPTFP